jgi:hypothetical protein
VDGAREHTLTAAAANNELRTLLGKIKGGAPLPKSTNVNRVLAEAEEDLTDETIPRCHVCRLSSQPYLLALCDTCNRRCHLECHEPALKSMPTKSKYRLWQCSYCDSSEDESEGEAVEDPTLGRGGGKSRRSVKKPTKFITSPTKDVSYEKALAASAASAKARPSPYGGSGKAKPSTSPTTNTKRSSSNSSSTGGGDADETVVHVSTGPCRACNGAHRPHTCSIIGKQGTSTQEPMVNSTHGTRTKTSTKTAAKPAASAAAQPLDDLMKMMDEQQEPEKQPRHSGGGGGGGTAAAPAKHRPRKRTAADAGVSKPKAGGKGLQQQTTAKTKPKPAKKVKAKAAAAPTPPQPLPASIILTGAAGINVLLNGMYLRVSGTNGGKCVYSRATTVGNDVIKFDIFFTKEDQSWNIGTGGSGFGGTALVLLERNDWVGSHTCSAGLEASSCAIL